MTNLDTYVKKSLDINSKTTENIYTIICDNREEIATANIDIIDALYSENTNLKIPINIIIKRIELGDYVVNKLIFERKTILDLITSLRSGDRLLSQFKRLCNALLNDSEVLCFLCIIGDPDIEIRKYLQTPYIRKKLFTQELFNKEYTRIRRSIDAIIAKFNIYGIYSSIFKTIEDFAYFILKCIHYRYIKKTEYRIPQKFKAIVKNDLNMNEQVSIVMLKGIPGIGDDLARRILNNFGDIKNLCNASLEEIQEITAPKSQIPSAKKRNIANAKLIYNSLRNNFEGNNIE